MPRSATKRAHSSWPIEEKVHDATIVSCFLNMSGSIRTAPHQLMWVHFLAQSCEFSCLCDSLQYAIEFYIRLFESEDLTIYIRTRRMRPSGCAAWECGSRRRTDRNGVVP